MFNLPKLPYDYSALEPYFDEQTMRIHHDKHHGTYVDNLNKLNTENLSLEELLKSKDQKIINMVGGHVNHSFFWEIMTPEKNLEPVKEILNLKDEFSSVALTLFGSGWAWIVKKNGKLKVITTPNQNSPLMQGLTPILGIDVWEHAYYLKYQNRRIEYIEAWWNIINWKKVKDNLA